MTPLELALLGVAAALVLLTGHGVLPGLLVLLQPARLRCRFLEADQEARVLGASPLLEEHLQRLKAQHFYLLGVKAEKLPLWGREDREVALAARDQSAFASIVLQPFGAPACIYLYTPLAGGGMVFTRDYAGGLQFERERISVRNVPTEDLERLVADHRARVDAMLAKGAALGVRPSRAGRIEATTAFYATDYFRLAAGRAMLPGLTAFVVTVILMLWAAVSPFLG